MVQSPRSRLYSRIFILSDLVPNVSESLLRLPYEPLKDASIKHTTLKCVFLLAIATGRRRGYIHSLSTLPHCLRWSRDRSSVTLLTDPSYLAKNQVRNFIPDHIKIPSLASVVGPDDRDRYLCPLRALGFYLDKTKGARSEISPISPHHGRA